MGYTVHRDSLSLTLMRRTVRIQCVCMQFVYQPDMAYNITHTRHILCRRTPGSQCETHALTVVFQNSTETSMGSYIATPASRRTIVLMLVTRAP